MDTTAGNAVTHCVMCSFPLRLEQYEVLSGIQEIRGLLRIQGWEGVSFPYLRNLKIIGSQNGTKFTTQCGTGMDRKNIKISELLDICMHSCLNKLMTVHANSAGLAINLQAKLV